MTIATSLVLFAVIWLLCFMVSLPLRIRTQSESGKVSHGTPPSAPVHPMLWAKAKWGTVAAIAIWLPVAAAIEWNLLTIQNIDFFNRWGDGKYG